MVSVLPFMEEKSTGGEKGGAEGCTVAADGVSPLSSGVYTKLLVGVFPLSSDLFGGCHAKLSSGLSSS